MRHIKVKATVNYPLNTEVRLEFLSVSHNGDNFSKAGKSIKPYHHLGCFAHSNTILINQGRPVARFFAPLAEDKHHYVEFGGPNPVMIIPIKYWDDVKRCLEEYNRWGATAEGRS